MQKRGFGCALYWVLSWWLALACVAEFFFFFAVKMVGRLKAV
jgi:hypothetical protein